MDFSRHNEFRQDIEDQFSSYYKKYPKALLLLDYVIQLRVLEKHKDTWVTENHFFRYFDSLIHTDLLTKVYCTYLRFASFFVKKSLFTIHYSIDSQKFPGLKEAILQACEQNNWRVVSQGNTRSSLWDMLFLKTITPYRYFLCNRSKELLLKFKVWDQNEWLALLDNHELMTSLNNSVAEDIKRSRRLIQRLGINIWLNTGDASGNARVLIEASKGLDIKVLSIAHGYISETALMSIIPVHSHKLILWTKKQLSDISQAINNDQRAKLAYIGFPKQYYQYSSNLSKPHILIIMGSIKKIVEDNLQKNLFLSLINNLVSICPNVTLRLHPNERSGVLSIDNFLSDHNLKLSSSSLTNDIQKSSLIVGARTSTLVEAASSGKSIFQIKELMEKDIEFEGTTIISISDISKLDNLQSNNIDDQNVHLRFDKELISNNFARLISTL